MFGKKVVSIANTEVHNRNTVFFKLSYPKSIQKYFSSDYIYAEYSTKIDCVDESILNIPAVSALVPFAWAVGVDLSVKKLDKTFFESLSKIRPIMEKWHSNFSFSTKIEVEEIVSNQFSNKEFALLFSGGLDSTVSYIRNRDKKPQLISIRGLDVPIKRPFLWKNVKKQLTAFASQENLKIHFIKSNVRELFFENLLSVEFGQSWWVRVSHGLVTLGLCAPLTGQGFGTVLIASTRGPQFPGEVRYPLGSSPLIDEKISWADVRVIHDCYRFNRQQKIRHVLKPFIETEYHPILRVCTDLLQDLNCSQCHKCLNTMAGLVLEGIDPNKCGFRMTDKTLTTLKQSFLNREYEIFAHDFVAPEFIWRIDDWKEIQTEIPQNLKHNLYNSKQFFNWLRDFDLEKYGTEMEQRMSKQRLLAVIKYRLLGCTLTLNSFLPKKVQCAFTRVHNLADYYARNQNLMLSRKNNSQKDMNSIKKSL